MRRRLFTFGSAVSLLLCVAVCALWARSCFVRDSLGCADQWSNTDGSATRDDREWYAVRGHVAYTRHMTHYPAIAVPDVGPAAALRLPRPEGTARRHWTWECEVPRWTTPTDTLARRLGFGRANVSRPQLPSMPGMTYSAVWAPLWAAGATMAVLPTWWAAAFWRRRQRQRRATRGHCSACGYDLRATPGRCPECGRAAA